MESASLAATEAAGADSAVEGTVRVGAPDGFGVAFLAPRLPELVARKLTDYRLGLYPQVT